MQSYTLLSLLGKPLRLGPMMAEPPHAVCTTVYLDKNRRRLILVCMAAIGLRTDAPSTRHILRISYRQSMAANATLSSGLLDQMLDGPLYLKGCMSYKLKR